MTRLTPGGLLALDLAGTVGWAYGPLSDRMPAFGTWHLPKVGGEGARYVAFENTLAEMMDKVQPARMLLEAALPLMAQTDIRTCRQQLTLRGLAYAEAYRGSCAVSEIDAFSVRSAILGRGQFPKKGQIKIEVVQYCYRRGWRVPDHNAGDACMLWEWNRRQVTGIAPAAGPLWA